MTLAEQIARIVLENSAAAYFVLPPTQHAARERVIQAAAVKVQAILDAHEKPVQNNS
jgi:hypothetical protein